MKTFRVDGHLFKVTQQGDLQYFVPDFDPVTGLQGMGGFFKSIGKIFKKVWKPVAIGAAAYYGYKAVSGGSIGNPLSKISLPSAATITKAAGIAATLYTANIANQQAQLQTQYDTQPVQTALDTPQNQAQSQGSNSRLPDSVKPSLDNTTKLMLGGGALVLILMLVRK